jgi:L-asparaginase/Glu-tRNA(Gln) amidotransferase subunit D
MQHLPHLHQADWHVWAMPTLIDSSQLTPNDWAPLLTQLLTCYAQGVRQIVVIHGTDTLAYTAAFLAEALAGSDLCVVVTGSQLPFLNAQATQLADPSDAIDNLRTACGVLLRDQAGVYVAFNGEYWPAQTVQKIHSRDLSAFTGHSRAGYPASGYRTLNRANAGLMTPSRIYLAGKMRCNNSMFQSIMRPHKRQCSLPANCNICWISPPVDSSYWAMA